MRGTTAIVAPATRITAANFSENDAPRQMARNQRTPRIDLPQSERRTRTSDATAMVAATSIDDSARAYKPPGRVSGVLTGRPAGGMVSAGGASTGDRGRAAGSGRGGGVCVVSAAGGDEPVACGAAPRESWSRAGGDGAWVARGTGPECDGTQR